MVIIFIPTVSIKEITTFYKTLAPESLIIATIMWMIAVIWASTVFILFRALWSIKNPGKSVTGAEDLGAFFHSANYEMSAIDCLFNFPIKSKNSLQIAISSISNDDEWIIKELVYEKMKLEYIRDIKMRRCSVSAVLILVWVALGTAIYTYSLLR
ncbi:hypothetical protein D3C78_1472590 [compost metagenome]